MMLSESAEVPSTPTVANLFPSLTLETAREGIPCSGDDAALIKLVAKKWNKVVDFPPIKVVSKPAGEGSMRQVTIDSSGDSKMISEFWGIVKSAINTGSELQTQNASRKVTRKALNTQIQRDLGVVGRRFDW